MFYYSKETVTRYVVNENLFPGSTKEIEDTENKKGFELFSVTNHSDGKQSISFIKKEEL